MNKPKYTTPAASQAICGPAGEVDKPSIAIDFVMLNNMSMRELVALREVVHTAYEMFCGFVSQPRFAASDRENNAAGHEVEKLADWLCEYEIALVNAAHAASPTNPDDIHYRWRVILGHQAEMVGGCLATLSSMAAAAGLDEHDAKCRGILKKRGLAA
jgi:hypothetical protein